MRDDDEGRAADEQRDHGTAGQRIEQQAQWVDLQVRHAIERGEFDDLPGAGKPIPGLDGRHDPDWWAKRLIEREQLTGLAPPAIALRTEDAELDEQLDRETSEPEVRRILVDFNERVRRARLQLQGGPPVITRTRDIDAEVAAWRERRAARQRLQRDQLQRSREDDATAERRRPWWRRARRR